MTDKSEELEYIRGRYILGASSASQAKKSGEFFDKVISELIRKVREEAWDEGFEEWSASPAGDHPLWDNPYSNGSNET